MSACFARFLKRTLVPTPFFYDTVTIQRDTYLSSKEKDAVVKWRVSTQTSDEELARITRPTYNETHVFISVGPGDYAYIAFSGMLTGSRFDCVLRDYDRWGYRLSTPEFNSKTVKYFADKEQFNAWSSNSKKWNAETVAKDDQPDLQFSVTTKVDSRYEMFLVINNDEYLDTASWSVNCAVTAVQFDTSKGFLLLFVLCCFFIHFILATPVNCESLPCNVAIPLSGETTVFVDQLPERLAYVASYDYIIEVKQLS